MTAFIDIALRLVGWGCSEYAVKPSTTIPINIKEKSRFYYEIIELSQLYQPFNENKPEISQASTFIEKDNQNFATWNTLGILVKFQSTNFKTLRNIGKGHKLELFLIRLIFFYTKVYNNTKKICLT